MMIARPARDGISSSSRPEPVDGPLLTGTIVTVFPGARACGSAASSAIGGAALDAGAGATVGTATASALEDASGGVGFRDGASAASGEWRGLWTGGRPGRGPGTPRP